MASATTTVDNTTAKVGKGVRECGGSAQRSLNSLNYAPQWCVDELASLSEQAAVCDTRAHALRASYEHACASPYDVTNFESTRFAE